MTFIIDVPLSLTLCSGRDRQSVAIHISSIIDVPLSLTFCCGRDRKNVVVSGGKMKTPLVQ